MTQPGEAGITGIGEGVLWDSSAPTRQFFKPELGVPQGFGMPGRRERRPSHVVAEKRLHVQFLEGTSAAASTG